MENAGALAFGLIIGWYVYYINRYRKADVQFSDITTLVGAIGGGALLSLFDAEQGTLAPILFGYYGIGLAVGFFAYFLTLIILVRMSRGAFNATWFLDGRRLDPPAGWAIPEGAKQSVTPMASQMGTTFIVNFPGGGQSTVTPDPVDEERPPRG